MQERQVTIENNTLKLSSPFVVLATQNPIEYEGTYPLPEAQLDRFLIKIGIGYPSAEDEATMLDRRAKREKDEIQLEQIVTKDQVLEMQKEVEAVHIDLDLEEVHRGDRAPDSGARCSGSGRESQRINRADEAFKGARLGEPARLCDPR